MKNTKSQLEISCHPVEGLMDFENNGKRPSSSSSGADLSKDLNKLIEGGPESLEDRQKWQLLTRELAQKQEIIHRMMKENDDKSASLKLTTAEIVDLRRTIKMLQSENAILRKKYGDEETIELQNLVAKEISHMT